MSFNSVSTNAERRPVVVGGGVSALVAADALQASGERVLLLLPKYVGAGFLPLEKAGRILPLGCRIMELVVDIDHPRVPPPLNSYVPGYAAHRDWLGPIHEWFEEKVGDQLGVIVDPELYLEGNWGTNFCYHLDPSDLASQFSATSIDAIERESDGAVAEHGAQGLLNPIYGDDLWKTDLEQASLQTHGPTFHRLILDALASKLIPSATRGVPAALRRKMWLPMFWSETLNQAIRGVQQSWRPADHRQFHVWGKNDIVSVLLKTLRSCELVEIQTVGNLNSLDAHGDEVTLGFSDAAPVRARNPIMAVSPAELFATGGGEYNPDRVPTRMAWVEVPNHQITHMVSTAMIADPSSRMFRINTGGWTPDPSATVFNIELSHDVPEEMVGEVATSELKMLGFVRENAIMRVIDTYAGLAYTAPSLGNMAAHTRAQEKWLDRQFPVIPVGSAAAFAADSLNEQAMMGLWAAERCREPITVG